MSPLPLGARQARAKRDFEAADQLRTGLRESGVRLEDKQGAWFTEDGRRYTPSPNHPWMT